MPVKDPEKRREAHRKYMREVWYPKNREKHIRAVRPNAKRAYEKYAKFLLEYKQTHPCTRCGEADPACLDFHHTDPAVKEFNVARAGGKSLKKCQVEIDKCVVLCSNCHRKLHAYESVAE